MTVAVLAHVRSIANLSDDQANDLFLVCEGY
jgi:hypothetical protein